MFSCMLQLILCKDNANERQENLFSIDRVQLILCKDTSIYPMLEHRNRCFYYHNYGFVLFSYNITFTLHNKSSLNPNRSLY